MRMMLGAILAVALAGCATTPPYPQARPLTQAHMEAMGPTPVVLSENNNGVEKAWFYTSTSGAGAAYGLVGVLVSAAMDAIINAGPSMRAQKAANEIAELMPVEALNASLLQHLQQQSVVAPAADVATTEAVVVEAVATATETPAAAAVVAPTPVLTVSFSGAERAQRLTIEEPLEDAVTVSVRYTLSEDSSTLRVIAQATYQNAQTPYATPYQFESSVPRAELEGPAYRNTFTYYSTQLPVPTLTPELQARLIASVEDSARDESGALPAEGTNEYQSLQRELENARDGRLSKDEIAIFLTREWLRDDGVLLRQEIERAHAFVAKYLLLDLNRTAVPSLVGQDELLEVAADDRSVRRIGVGVEAGSYVSSSGDVSSFSTYGNAIGIARVHRERMDDVRDAARDTRRATR